MIYLLVLILAVQIGFTAWTLYTLRDALWRAVVILMERDQKVEILDSYIADLKLQLKNQQAQEHKKTPTAAISRGGM